MKLAYEARMEIEKAERGKLSIERQKRKLRVRKKENIKEKMVAKKIDKQEWKQTKKMRGKHRKGEN